MIAGLSWITPGVGPPVVRQPPVVVGRFGGRHGAHRSSTHSTRPRPDKGAHHCAGRSFSLWQYVGDKVLMVGVVPCGPSKPPDRAGVPVPLAEPARGNGSTDSRDRSNGEGPRGPRIAASALLLCRRTASFNEGGAAVRGIACWMCCLGPVIMRDRQDPGGKLQAAGSCAWLCDHAGSYAPSVRAKRLRADAGPLSPFCSPALTRWRHLAGLLDSVAPSACSCVLWRS